MKCLGIGSIEEVMSRQSPEEASSSGGAFQGEETSASAAAHRVTSARLRGGEQGSAREEVLPVWVLSCVLILFSWENSTTLPISLTEFSNMVMDLFHKNSYCGVFPCRYNVNVP